MRGRVLEATLMRGVEDVLLMIQILHHPKDPKLWKLWYVSYYGSCRIYIINHYLESLLLPL